MAVNEDPVDGTCGGKCQTMYQRVKGRWWFEFGKFVVTVGLAFLIGFYTLRQEIGDLQARVGSVDQILQYVEKDVLDIQVAISPINTSVQELVANVSTLNASLNALDLDQLTLNVSLLTLQVSNLSFAVDQLDIDVNRATENFSVSSQEVLSDLSQYNASIWQNLLNWSVGFENEMNQSLQVVIQNQTLLAVSLSKVTPVFFPIINVFQVSTSGSRIVNVSLAAKMDCAVAIFQYQLWCSCSACSQQLKAQLLFGDPISGVTQLNVFNSWINTPSTLFSGIYEAMVPLNSTGSMKFTANFVGSPTSAGANIWLIGCFLRLN